VQAALTGVSAAYDAQGRLLASMSTAQRGLLTVRLGLEPGTALTPFDRYGDVVPWTAIGIALLAAAAGLGTWRRHRRVQITLEVNPGGSESVSLLRTSRGHAAGSESAGPGEGSASSQQTGR
jgi:2-methylcitrate dehydratase PrpD